MSLGWNSQRRLSSRIASARKELEEAINDVGPSSKIRAVASELELLSGIRRAKLTRTVIASSSYLLVAFLIVCGVAYLVRVPFTDVVIQGKIAEVQITNGGGAGVFMPMQRVDSHEVEDDSGSQSFVSSQPAGNSNPKQISVDGQALDLTWYKNAVVRVRHMPPKCLAIEVGGKVGESAIQVGETFTGHEARTLRLMSGNTLRMCTKEPVTLSFANATEVYFARIERSAEGPLRLPTMRVGTIRYPSLEGVRDLDSGAILLFNRVQNGLLLLNADESTMNALFTGTVYDGIGEGTAPPIFPTVFDWVANNRLIKGGLSLVAGLLGLVWNLRGKLVG